MQPTLVYPCEPLHQRFIDPASHYYSFSTSKAIFLTITLGVEVQSQSKQQTPPARTHCAFQDTRWSMVIRAANGSREALEDLSKTYWPAVYAFLRHKGLSPHDAEDVTQNTFARLLNQSTPLQVAPENGRFRSFLCACAQHESAHLREHNHAIKRGGPFGPASLEMLDAEKQYQLLPSTSENSEQLFDRSWSQLIVSRALENIKSEYARLGKTHICETLIPLLNSGTDRGGHRVIAEKLGLSEINARVTWSRFKKSFIEHLRHLVVETVNDPSEIDAELRHLLAAWFSEPSEPKS